MDIKIELVNKDNEEQYLQYIQSKEDAMIYVSLSYRDMLMDLLGDESYYLMAKCGDEVKGILPVMIHSNDVYGNVANSLPYYGSNGGIMADTLEVKEKLLEAYYAVIKENKCVAGTIVTTPFEKDYMWYRKKMNPAFMDMRIGQIASLPENVGENAEFLMSRFHYKTRWSIRKAEKNDIIVKVENTKDGLEFLYNTHQENMEKKGGGAKSKKFFDVFQKYFAPVKDYNIYVAYKDDKIIAALLLFYYNQMVEYYMPVIIEEYRPLQPLSLIIFTAMIDAIELGFKKWDWGGTWVSQESLHRFKERWGSQDFNYYYYTNIWDDKILKLDKDIILQNYKNYYVYPFDGGIEAGKVLDMQKLQEKE